MNVKVVIEQGEDGYFVAHCPSLKSCWSQGRTGEEAVENIKQAIALYNERSRVGGRLPSRPKVIWPYAK